MNLVLFIVVVTASFVVVRIGAVALHLTGIEWALAKFQALSCFTGTGFTTREAEIITGHPKRRRIASFLMVLGNAGLITLIATFANSLRPGDYFARMRIPFLSVQLPRGIAPVMNLLFICLFLWLLYRVSIRSSLMGRFNAFLGRYLTEKELVRPVSFEELLVATGGYGISHLTLTTGSPVLGKTIKDPVFLENNINVLAVERGGEIVPNPSPEMTLLAGDKLICFGKLDNIREKLLTR